MRLTRSQLRFAKQLQQQATQAELQVLFKGRVLDIKVAEWTRDGVHHLANRRRLAGVAHINLVAQTSLARRWLVGPGNVAIVALVDSTETVLAVNGLPSLCQYVLDRVHDATNR